MSYVSSSKMNAIATTVKGELDKKTPLTTVAPAYDSATVYKSGVLLTYDQKLYECIKDATAGTLPTNATYFKEVTVKEELDSKITFGSHWFDGTGGVAYADLSGNLDSKLGITDTTPFLSRTTAGGEEVANTSKVHKIIGGSLPIVQLLSKTFASSTTINGITFTNNNDGSWSVSGTATATAYVLLSNIAEKVDDVYMIAGGAKGGTGLSGYTLWDNTNGAFDNGNGCIYKSTGTGGIYIRVAEGTIISTPIKFKPNHFNLTATFGATVANRLLALETATAGAGVAKVKQILVKDYYPFNTTAFTHVKTSGKVNTGFNQFNIEKLLNVQYATKSGNYYVAGASQIAAAVAADHSLIFSNEEIYYKGRIEVILHGKAASSGCNARIRFYYADGTYSEGTQYINDTEGTFKYISTTDKEVAYVSFGYSSSKNLYIDKMCVSFYWDGERDGEYEDYQEFPYPCSDVELKGVISLDANDNWVYDGDEYLPDGTINEYWKEKTVSSSEVSELTSISYTNVKYFYISKPSDYIYSNVYHGVLGNVICDKFIARNGAGNYNTADCVGSMFGDASQNIFWFGFAPNTTLAQAQSALDGVRLLYKLATQTTSSADPYTEQQSDDNWGAERWIDNRDVPLPVSAEIEYLPDLKAKTESEPSNPDEDGDYVMHRENGENSYTPLATWLTNNGYNKMQVLSDQITDAAGLTYAFKYAYKIGKIVSITVRATNNTGAAIQSGTTLFTLGSGLIPEGALYVMANIGNSVISSCNIANNGNVAVFGNSIDSGATVAFTFTYAVA